MIPCFFFFSVCRDPAPVKEVRRNDSSFHHLIPTLLGMRVGGSLSSCIPTFIKNKAPEGTPFLSPINAMLSFFQMEVEGVVTKPLTQAAAPAFSPTLGFNPTLNFSSTPGFSPPVSSTPISPIFGPSNWHNFMQPVREMVPTQGADPLLYGSLNSVPVTTPVQKWEDSAHPQHPDSELGSRWGHYSWRESGRVEGAKAGLLLEVHGPCPQLQTLRCCTLWWMACLRSAGGSSCGSWG